MLLRNYRRVTGRSLDIEVEKMQWQATSRQPEFSQKKRFHLTQILSEMKPFFWCTYIQGSL